MKTKRTVVKGANFKRKGRERKGKSKKERAAN